MNNETTPKVLTNDEVISTLNGLIETCKDGQEGFKTSAESVKNADLVSTFQDLSSQRALFAGELRSLVSSLGGDPENGGTILGTLHRGWLNIKSVVTGGNEGAILDECERGEDAAKDAYKNALENMMPSDITGIVRRQYDAVLDAHRKIKTLRDNANNTASSSAASGS
jgi:uncharacterized protein (TIGR02284 family)